MLVTILAKGFLTLNESESKQWSFPEFAEFSDKIFVITVKGFEPATCCVGHQDVIAMPARHMWEMGSLNRAQFMLQWFIRFRECAEFTEFNESSDPLKKITNVTTAIRMGLLTNNPANFWNRIFEEIHMHQENCVQYYTHCTSTPCRSTHFRLIRKKI